MLGTATISLAWSFGGSYNLASYTEKISDLGLLYMDAPMARWAGGSRHQDQGCSSSKMIKANPMDSLYFL